MLTKVNASNKKGLSLREKSPDTHANLGQENARNKNFSTKLLNEYRQSSFIFLLQKLLQILTLNQNKINDSNFKYEIVKNEIQGNEGATYKQGRIHLCSMKALFQSVPDEDEEPTGGMTIGATATGGLY